MKSFFLYVFGINYFTQNKLAKLITPEFSGYDENKSIWRLWGFIEIRLKNGVGGDTFWSNLRSNLTKKEFN